MLPQTYDIVLMCGLYLIKCFSPWFFKYLQKNNPGFMVFSYECFPELYFIMLNVIQFPPPPSNYILYEHNSRYGRVFFITTPKAKGRETQRYYSGTTWRWAFFFALL